MKRQAKAEALLPGLIEKILLFLPVKSLIRFKCVSKQWLSLISDSRFAKLHYDTADAAPTNYNTRLLYLNNKVSKARCIDLEASILSDYALQLPISCRYFPLTILGSCRGFILLRTHIDGTDLILWNPATGSHKAVPYPVADPTASCWMGFERTNSWNEIECGHLPGHLPMSYCAIFCNGAIHWLANIGIVAFDVARKHLYIMSLPDMKYCFNWKLDLFGGCLGISYLTNNWKIGLWVMKEYNVESSWTKPNGVLPCDDELFFFLCFTNGGELVGIQNNTKLIKFNDKGAWADSLAINCERTDKMMVMFTQSLLSLRTSFGVQGKNKESRVCHILKIFN
ncbi:hypothetical protein PIB30_059466 [Stylosanthes scabra]|uniref:F-box domain-containing protein n=1 Tax=Stylosanthes scabra TaxID=79078 RepID=A0ABU6YM58_9FABA|nr:hypothetical protein [Stylosanthes scabra]